MANDSRADIQNVEGDVIGIGVSGNGNIIGKDITLVMNQVQTFGLNLLSTNYFREYKSGDQDIIDWKNGFSFKLESIKEKKELRRSVVDTVRKNLEREYNLLILGESGFSKSTILMEIMCEYYEEGYKILYNFGDVEIKNSSELVKFIEELLTAGNKTLVAIDNVHNERTAAIFHVIDQLSNHSLHKNLFFILTARLPEFDWLVNDRLNKIEESYRHSIRKFVQHPNYKFELEAFTKNEILDFVKMYKDQTVNQSDDQLCDLALKIFKETKGHPIMVKFYVLDRGLDEDVKDRYFRYLIDPQTAQPDLAKINTILICILLDIANLPITDKLLEKIGILCHAYDLEHAMLYQFMGGFWKTIHPKWGMSLLFFLYNEKNNSILFKRKEFLKNSLKSLFDISDEYLASSIIQTLYDLVLLKIISIDIVESIVSIPEYVSTNTKSNLYLFSIGLTYRILQMYPQMMDYYNKALLMSPNNILVLNANAVSLGFLKRYDEALICCNKSLKMDPNNISAWTNKGLILNGLKKYDEALECWKKAIEIDDGYVIEWNKKPHFLSESRDYDQSILNRILTLKLISKGASFCFLKKYQEALECSNKALELDPNISLDGLSTKAWALNGLKKYDEALECSNKALELDKNNVWVLSNKAWALNGLKRYDEALECSNIAIELDSKNDFSTLTNKAVSLNGLKKYDEALECSNKALQLNSKTDWTWLVKGVVLNGLKRYDEALECSNKALELDSHNDLSWNNKSWALNGLTKYDKALESCNRALELDSKNAWAWANKAVSLNGLKKYDEALECNNNAEALDKNNIPPAFILLEGEGQEKI